MLNPPHRDPWAGSDLIQASPWEQASPSTAGVSQQTGRACGDCSHHSHLGRRLREQGPLWALLCHWVEFHAVHQMQLQPFHRLLAAGSWSWTAAFAQCCTQATNPAPESRHTGSCFPAGYTPHSASSLRPVHSALVSWTPWDKRLTHSRECLRIQTRHEVIRYFKNRTLALSPPKVFSSRCLSKGLKAAQWRKQSTATMGTGLSQQVPTFQWYYTVLVSLQLEIRRYLVTVPLSFKSKQKVSEIKKSLS